MVSHDELAIAIALLLAWGLGKRLWFSTERPKRGRRSHAGRIPSRSLMVVLDEELLTRITLLGWVMFVLWATELRALRSAAGSSGGWLMKDDS